MWATHLSFLAKLKVLPESGVGQEWNVVFIVYKNIMPYYGFSFIFKGIVK